MKDMLLSGTHLIVDRYSYSGVAYSVAKVCRCAAAQRVGAMRETQCVVHDCMTNCADKFEMPKGRSAFFLRFIAAVLSKLLVASRMRVKYGHIFYFSLMA